MEKIILPQLMDQMIPVLVGALISSLFAVIRITTKVLMGEASFKIFVSLAYCLSGFSVGFFTGAVLPADNKYWLAIVIAVGYYSVKIIEVGHEKVGAIFDKLIKKG